MVFRAALVLPLLVPAVALAQESTPATPAAPAAETAQAPAPTATPDLLQRLDDVEQQARIANRKLELFEEAAAAKKKETPSVSADEKGFGIASADKAFELKLRGLVQLDARRHMDTSDPALADRDTFVPRRIRPIFEGTLIGLADFRIMPDFGNGTAVLMDGYLDVHPRPWLRFRAGKFKPPIGLERLQNDAYLPLIERALDANLTPQRDVGLQLWGDVLDAFVRYELGIFNGAPDNASTDIDNNHGKTYGGRLFLRPFQLPSLKGLGDLGVGIAVSTGNEKGSPALTNGVATNTWLSSVRSAGQNTIYSYLVNTMDVTQTVFALKRHTRVNPQLYYFYGPVGVLAEWVRVYQEVGKGTQTGAVNHQAGHVTASFVIGGDNGYDGVKPKKPANLATKDLGAIELAARFNWIDFDDVSFEGSTLATAASVTSAKGLGLGLSWWLSRNLRASANWEQTKFQGGNNRPTEKVFISRFQVAF